MSIKPEDGTFLKFIPHALKFFVYVAGPISKGPWDHNMRQATKAYIMLVHAGLIPFVPHSTSQLVRDYVPDEAAHDLGTDSYEFWLDYDFSYIRDVCNAILRLPGESWGTDREEEFADYLHMPVFTDIDELFDYAEEWGVEVNREAAHKFGKEFDHAIHKQGSTKKIRTS